MTQVEGRGPAAGDRSRRRGGYLCPVCMRATDRGHCRRHGPWQPHQLATVLDRRRASRSEWLAYEPVIHACPRCLGEVAESRGRFECLEHGHGHDTHGPFRTDELLGPTAQREAAMARDRVVRTRRRQSKPPFEISMPQLPDLGHLFRILVAGIVIAATLAFLAH